MTEERLAWMDGKVQVYRRENRKFRQCAVYLRRAKPPPKDTRPTFRDTYISLRLMEGAEIYQVAKRRVGHQRS